MSISQLFPAISPSLSLNFARSKTLDPRITFTRTSSGTRTNERGLVEVVPANSPRLDHSYDPVSGSVRSLGLLVEEQRINYETYTEDPTQWITLNMIPTGNSVILPTGQVSTTVEYQGETTDPNSKIIRPLPSGSGITAGDTWVFSIFLKAGTEDTVNVNMQNNTGTEGIRVNTFNMLTGEDSGVVGTATNGEFGAIKYPNGWWRVYIRCTFANNASGIQTVIRLQGFSNQVSDTTSFSAWGAQLEKASFPTSYIPNNTGSQITRNPDNVSMTGENFLSWYNPSEGSIHSIISLTRQMTTAGSGTWTLDDGNFARGISLYHASAPNVRVATRDATFQQTSGDVSSVDLSKLKSCTNILKSVTSESISCHNGIFTGITTYSLDVNINRLLIGLNNIIGNPTNNYLNGTISQLTYYPRRLTNSQLQNLTK
jgi:hypothetical protein